MKQSEVKHILDTSEEELKEKQLIFTHYINVTTGEKQSDTSHPSNWDNVKHITGNLYYAYDDIDYTNTYKGSVFVGEFK